MLEYLSSIEKGSLRSKTLELPLGKIVSRKFYHVSFDKKRILDFALSSD